MAAGLGFKDFTTGEVLTAADVDGYLMQGIWVFANATARDAAVTSPQEGNFAFTKDNNSLWYYDGAAWVASGATGDIEGVTAGIGISGGGTSGTVTVTNSMATAIDAKGDLVAGTGADTFARLAVGANDTVLTADSSTATGLKWASVSGGGMTLISSTDVTGQSTHTVSSIPDTYRNLMIYVKNYRPSSTGQLRVRFNSDSTANRHYDQVQGTTSNINFGSTSIRFSNGQESTTTSNSFGFGLIADYANTTTWKTCDWFNVLTNVTNTNNFNYDYGVGIYNQVGAVTSLQFFPATGSFNGGVIEIYGVK